jgi:hypothetical protein
LFVGFDQLADVERRMTAERCHVLAGHGRMVHTSVAWLRIQLMIGIRAWPKTISE